MGACRACSNSLIVTVYDKRLSYALHNDFVMHYIHVVVLHKQSIRKTAGHLVN